MINKIHLSKSNWMKPFYSNKNVILNLLTNDTNTALNAINIIKHPCKFQYKNYVGKDAVNAMFKELNGIK